jgi:hypothetical protein
MTARELTKWREGETENAKADEMDFYENSTL